MRTTFLIALVAYVAVLVWGISAVEAADANRPEAPAAAVESN